MWTKHKRVMCVCVCVILGDKRKSEKPVSCFLLFMHKINSEINKNGQIYIYGKKHVVINCSPLFVENAWIIKNVMICG